MQQKKNKFFVNGKQLDLTILPGTFFPTATSNFLIESVQKEIKDSASILDLGCGSGVVGLSLYLSGKVKVPIYASDLSASAVSSSKVNFNFYNCPAEVKTGAMFNPWKGMKFDVIVDDISGVSEPIAKLSSWFPGVPCDSGEDGGKLISSIINDSSNYLNENGRIFFPIISLSNVDSILDLAKSKFKYVKLLSRNEWPLPDDLKVHEALLSELADKGKIKLIKKFAMLLCFTEIYMAYN